MSPAGAARAVSVVCWNCGQPLPAGSALCLYCGVPQDAPSAQLVLAPYGAVGTSPGGLLPPTAATSGSPVLAYETPSVLGDAFRGEPAGIGPRLAAVTIDVAAVVAVVAAVAVLTASIPLSLLVGGELAVGLCVVQARTGAGLGSALLRLRVSRTDEPFTPGIGRAAVRGLVTAAGALAFGVGVWVVEASAAWDRSRLRRSWADQAARTVVVAVPPRIRSPRAAVPRARATVPGMTVAEPAVIESPLVPVAPVSAPQLRGAGGSEPAAAEIAAVTIPPMPPPPVVAVTPVAAEPPAVTPQYRRGRGRTPEPQDAPPDIALPVAGVSDRGELLLVFDTGQRVQLPLGASANLGRGPAATQPGDQLITVADHEQTVSKSHARLEQTRTGVWITDSGSTNGTDLIDETGQVTPVPPGTRALVEDGVRVRLGNRVFTLSRLMSEDA